MATEWIDPATWADGVLTQQKINDGLANNMQMLGDPWPEYFVVLTGWTLSNGRLQGWWQELGKMIRGRIEYTIGSSDTKSGQPVFSLPVPVNSTGGAPIGHAGLAQGANREFWTAIAGGTGGSTIALRNAAGTVMSPTVPWTWATGNQMLIQFRYETT